jgi:translation initiation factor IF-2
VAPPPVTRSITLAEGMTVKDLADRLNLKAKDVLRKLLERRMMLTINSTLDTETASLIAREFGADVQMRSFEEDLVEMESEAFTAEDMVPRAPVVTVMGHVDHGKTTLLDAIREARVAEHEAGGITQHIGAYQVAVNGRPVVFLDTPGHEAFTLMRARGARVTDVVVLVVAADDGVMPQTKEAIDHARAAGVPIVVAINKIDKPGANAERVKRELTELGLMPEEWGGQTVTVEVSAKKRQNLDALLEMILLVTDLGDLKAAPKRNAAGAVLEAKLDKGRGPVATILVQDGTLRVGDTFIAGTIVGKVRALIDDRGRQVREAPPSTPVEVLGLGGLPQPGDTFQAITDAAKARQIAMFRQTQAKEKAIGGRSSRLTLQSLQQQIAEGGIKELPIIIKADVQGSSEVLADSLTKLSDDKVKIRIIHTGVGAINESDVLLASASNAIVIGFNVRPDRNAADVADRESVDIRLHSVIYNITDEIKKAMTGLLEPTLRETKLGTAEVRQIFRVPRAGTVAGCIVTDGRITRAGDAQARLLRDNVVVFEGRISSLRRFKDDVSEVKAGIECGIALERYNDLKPGDVIEAFVVERVAAAAS